MTQRRAENTLANFPHSRLYRLSQKIGTDLRKIQLMLLSIPIKSVIGEKLHHDLFSSERFSCRWN